MRQIRNIQDGLTLWFETWLHRQPWKDIPVFLAFLLAIAFVCVVVFWDPIPVSSRYTGYLNNALAKGDYKTALVASQRLMTFDASRNLALFGMVLANQGLGQKEKALSFLQTVAPPDRPVFAMAHMYAAKSMMRLAGTNPRLVPQIIAQLKQVVALEPDSTEAHELLGSLYASQKEWALADRHYSEIVKEKPQYMFVLAQIAKKLNNDKAAENWSKDSIDHYQQAVEQSDTDNPKDRIAYIEALMFQRDFATAKTVLDKGTKLSGTEPYKQVTVAVCDGLLKQLAEEQPGNLGQRIKVLREGLEASHKNMSLLLQLLDLSKLHGEESPEAGDRILKTVDRTGIWPPLYFVAAKIAWNRQDPERSQEYLARACEGYPLGLAMANNLCAAIGSGDRKEELPFAMVVMDFVVAKAPDQPGFRIIRGLVLLHSARTQDALADLQFALEHLEDKTPAHQALAQTYLALGMNNLAQEHMLLSRESAKKPPGPDAEPKVDAGATSKPEKEKT